MAERICVRCQKPIPLEAHRRKFCSDACADSAMRDRIKMQKMFGRMQPRRWFTVTSYRRDTPPGP